MTVRLVYVLFGLASILWGPWWLTILFLITGIIIFADFFEGIGLALLFDVLYGTGSTWLGHNFALTLGLLGLMLVVEFARAKLLLRQ